MGTRIAVGTASEERLKAFLQLTESYYQGKTINEAAVVRWRHLDTPFGPSATVELMDGEASVGRMWIRTHPWSLRGRSVRAANPVDFLIRDDHRGLPAFMTLFKTVMKEAQQGSELVYHTSNPLTDDLYQKLMKLKPVTELDGAVMPALPFSAAQAAGVLNLGVAGRLLDGLFAPVLGLFGRLSRLGGIRLGPPPALEEQERVIGAFLAEEPICCERTASYRSWRFRGAGSVHYQEHWLYRQGRAIGYLVTTDRDAGRVRGCFVVDLVMPGRPSRLVLGSLWLQVAALAARRGRHAVFFLHNKANPRLARLASSPMVAIPRSRLPQGVPVFFRLPKEADPGLFAGLEFGSGYYVLSDFDMF